MPTLSYNQRYYAKNRVNILKKRRERYNQAVGITDAEPYEPLPPRIQVPTTEEKKERTKAYSSKYYTENREAILAKQKRRYKNNEEYREMVKESAKISMAKRRGKNYEPQVSYDMTEEPRTKIKNIKKSKIILPNPPSQEYLDWLWTFDMENEPSQGEIAFKFVKC